VPGDGYRFNAIAEEAGGTLWFAGARLMRYDNGRFTFEPFPPDWPRPYVHDALVDNHDVLWLATSNGLVRRENGRFERFTTTNGLSHSLCKALTLDARGHLWIGTLNGIDHYNDGRFQHLGVKDGLPSSEINRGAAFTDQKGNLWFGTVQGTTMLQAGISLDSVQTPPPVHITQLEIEGRPLDPSRPAPQFSYHQNDLSVRFTGISFADPEDLNFFTRLLPMDQDWQQNQVHALRYNNLPPGDYTFQVKAVRNGGERFDFSGGSNDFDPDAANTASYRFQIGQPFWSAAWFIVTASVLLLFFTFVLFRASVRRERLKVQARSAVEANKTKSAFLAHMSHELRTPLNAIIGYSEILDEDFPYNHQDEYLDDISKLQPSAHHLLSLINNILDISKIDSGKMMVFFEDFDAGTIIELVRSTAIPMVRKNQNELIVRCADVGRIRADKAKLRQVLLNLISNASQFTREGQVTLDISREKDKSGQWVVFRVVDTGVGMTTEEKRLLFADQGKPGSPAGFNHNGLGLLISKRFCDMMGAELSVESEPGKGSTFTVRLPAPKAVARA
jgi:signal transduction histidine kinase